jgi:hypothetical protein
MTEIREGKPPLRRYAAEVLTIVVGVLLALAADAGRQYLADRATEREILAALRVEFAADVREIGADQNRRARKLAAIALLDRERTGDPDDPPPDTLAAAVALSMDWRWYTASHPVLDDVLSTGRLELLRSVDLRRALMDFGQERARLAVIEQGEREFVAREVEPYLASRLDLSGLASPRSPEQRAAAMRALPDLLADQTFGSLLYLDRARTESSRDYAAGLLDKVSAVQAALGPERPDLP